MAVEFGSNRLSRMTTQLFYANPKEIARRVGKVGVVDALYNAFQCTEKTMKLAVSLFALFALPDAQKAFKDGVDFIYTFMVFNQLSSSYVDEKKHCFKLPNKNICSTTIFLVGSACQLPCSLMGLGLISLPRLSQWADGLGRYKFLQLYLCQMALHYPRDFSVFIGSGVSSIEECYMHYIKEHSIEQWMSADSSLKHTGNATKMALSWYGRTCFNQLWFLRTSVICNLASVITNLYFK